MTNEGVPFVLIHGSLSQLSLPKRIPQQYQLPQMLELPLATRYVVEIAAKLEVISLQRKIGKLRNVVANCSNELATVDTIIRE
jgi:hypothetical protein